MKCYVTALEWLTLIVGITSLVVGVFGFLAIAGSIIAYSSSPAKFAQGEGPVAILGAVLILVAILGAVLVGYLEGVLPRLHARIEASADGSYKSHQGKPVFALPHDAPAPSPTPVPAPDPAAEAAAELERQRAEDRAEVAASNRPPEIQAEELRLIDEEYERLFRDIDGRAKR